jgi:hypothetical protein
MKHTVLDDIIWLLWVIVKLPFDGIIL